MTTERGEDSEVGKILRRNIDIKLAELGLRPRELYESIGMPASTYSSMFKSEGGPNLARLRQLAGALECDVQELLDGIDEACSDA